MGHIGSQCDSVHENNTLEYKCSHNCGMENIENLESIKNIAATNFKMCLT